MKYKEIVGNIISIEKTTTKRSLDYQQILTKYEKDKFIKILENMIKNRFLDEEISQLIKEGVAITQHSTFGQEGSQTVAFSLLKKEDYGVPNHRGWGWAIGKGLDLKRIMAELMGKKTGYCQGKGGPHLADRENNLYLRAGIQGTYISLAAGIALGLKMQQSNSVCLCLFGDGSSNAGYVHEGMNIAATNKLPVIYFCENNLYALFTPYQETTSVADIADRAVGYGIPGYIVDGMDAFAVIEVMTEAIKRARNGEGPTLIESKTYRYEGHTSFDKFSYGGYRSKEEVEEWKKRDPITLFTQRLLESNLLASQELESLKEKIREEIKEAVEYATQSAYPEPEEYFKQVYAEKEVSY
ncbi:thiamine pyrophosphate-dependent dehydrogenase E1 component subunit alpha, partial [bacterium]|nr:thiamine pyrophosphate-dependent dehydrogenase E1 component subunit alpha [bacterium]MBU4510390.1 thiamine pyrophosphate-dependent dehydrogenase E1 component subunit alpha [bacterium]